MTSTVRLNRMDQEFHYWKDLASSGGRRMLKLDTSNLGHPSGISPGPIIVCHIYIYIYIYIYMHACIHTYIHICWFNFDALAQGNAYKPTKEPINYRGPGGDRTHDLQTEATPPAASCPARTLHATEIAPKNATPMTCPWLHWTTDNPSGMHRCQFQHLCVLILNCALALAIYIFVGLILMLWHRETHINPQRNR